MATFFLPFRGQVFSPKEIVDLGEYKGEIKGSRTRKRWGCREQKLSQFLRDEATKTWLPTTPPNIT